MFIICSSIQYFGIFLPYFLKIMLFQIYHLHDSNLPDARTDRTHIHFEKLRFFMYICRQEVSMGLLYICNY